jgi:hypothetical protein
MTPPCFQQLNLGWNADPNVPEPSVEVAGQDILLSFSLNRFQYPEFSEADVGVVRFEACSRYRLGETNDEGWYRGQCRYSKAAPAWGEFYEVIGPDEVADQPDDWVNVANAPPGRHFLFYFRDHTFECFAAHWLIEPVAANALSRREANV